MPDPGPSAAAGQNPDGSASSGRAGTHPVEPVDDLPGLRPQRVLHAQDPLAAGQRVVGEGAGLLVRGGPASRMRSRAAAALTGATDEQAVAGGPA